ncbi:MAG: hypothetical protein ACJ78Q_14165 [Chloroflexia bacterium]
MKTNMTTQEKILYHQIHPLKLLTDVSSGFYAVYLIWHHRTLPAIIVSFLPAVVTSLILVNTADLEPYKRSAAGRYIARIMSPTVQGLRLLGYVIMMAGGWNRRPRLIAAGFLGIVLWWTHGLLLASGREGTR